MADKLLVCISFAQATAARWHGGKLTRCEVFPKSEEGLAAFSEYLASLPSMPAYLAVDAVEEDYRFDTLPHAYGSDRGELVERKLRQHYRNTPYISATLQGRDSGKRRDDRYLFAALTNPELLGDWLKEIQARDLPIAGIYLLPMISVGLIEKLNLKASSQLIVSQQSSGIRLTYFRDSQFRLSRLSRGDSSRTTGPAQIYLDEISNTRLYLHALRTTTLDEHLAVLLLDRDDALTEVAQAIARDNPSMECTRLGSQEIAHRLGMDAALLTLSPDTMFLQLLAHKTPASNLAPDTVTVGFKRHQNRRAILGASVAIGIAGMAWVGYGFWQTFDLKEQTAEAARQTAAQQAQYQEVTRQFPSAPTSADNLKRTVEIAQKLREESRTPDAFLRIVSKALEPSPAIVVREIAWRYGTGEIDTAGSGGGTRAGAESPQSPPATPGNPEPAPARLQSGILEGEIRPFRGDYRAAVQTINAFAERLSRNPAVAEVRVLKLPLNVNPTEALSGNTLDSPDQSTVAPFRLLLRMKPNA